MLSTGSCLTRDIIGNVSTNLFAEAKYKRLFVFKNCELLYKNLHILNYGDIILQLNYDG